MKDSAKSPVNSTSATGSHIAACVRAILLATSVAASIGFGVQWAHAATNVTIKSFEGAWSASTSYTAGVVVTYRNASYIALVPSLGAAPTSNATDWSILDAPGATGPQGPAGPAGPAGAKGASTQSNDNSGVYQASVTATLINNDAYHLEGRAVHGNSSGASEAPQTVLSRSTKE